MATEPTPLDARVAFAIQEFGRSVHEHLDTPNSDGVVRTWRECQVCQMNQRILEGAIGARLDEPGAEPAIVATTAGLEESAARLGAPPPHLPAASEEAASRIVTEFELNWLRNLTVVCARVGRKSNIPSVYDAAVALEQWIERQLAKPAMWTERLDDYLRAESVRAIRSADIAGAAEPKPRFVPEEIYKPQHDLKRRLGAPLMRTSEHSSRVADVLYNLLGTTDPDLIAAWIVNARHAAGSLHMGEMKVLP